MPIVGGLDIHRKQITFDYLDTVTGEVRRGQIAPADRGHVRAWLARFAGHGDVAFAVEGCAGWRYVAGELAAAGIAAHLGEPADTAALRGRKRHAKTDKTDARHLRALLAEGLLRGVDLEDVGDTDLGDVLVVENPAGRGLAGLGGARGVASGAQGVAVTSVIAARAAAWSAMA